MILMRVVLAIVWLALAAAHPRPRRASGVQRAAWLQGCWESRSPKGTIEEQWMAPRSRSMAGVRRTIGGDSLAEFELVVLRERNDRLAYEAHPSGRSFAVFLSTLVTDSSAVFENRAHDFPQQVGYRRIGGDSLLAWVEGSVAGTTRRFDFQYRRVRCASP